MLFVSISPTQWTEIIHPALEPRSAGTIIKLVPSIERKRQTNTRNHSLTKLDDRAGHIFAVLGDQLVSARHIGGTKATMLEPLREDDQQRQNMSRASESCVRRLDSPLEPPRRSLVRHSLGSSWPALGSSQRATHYSEHISPKRTPAPAEAPRQYTAERNSDELAESYSLPPSLNYTLRDKKLRIAIFWCFIMLDCAVMPIGLYFILWYEAGPGSQEKHALSANTVLSIVTAAIGGSSILEYLLRAWKLWKQGSDCRVGCRFSLPPRKELTDIPKQVLGAQNRWCFDWFHWWFGLCLLIVATELVL